MAELPELLILARQMNSTVTGEIFREFDLRQPKCLNVPAQKFEQLRGKKITGVECRGKWVLIRVAGEWVVALGVGMGGDVYHYRGANAVEKYQVRVGFESGAGFTVRFWWFGHFDLVRSDVLEGHPAGQVGLAPMEASFSREALAGLTRGSRRNIKSLVTDQRCIAGIGNAYIHDILFLAGLHPLTPASALSAKKVDELHQAIRQGLQRIIDKNGLAYERDFFGKNGGFEKKDFLVGYREKEPCPVCGTEIKKIKAAGGASYVCPKCQPLLARV